ncbi:c-type cytochrome [Rhodoplanes azumiensis]|uniref:C-type cytochrome n=1 Tax=Rhodoplanes azumiensis TaxID=1897628 RepID=A0ABW5AEW0_9BRAD
MVAATAVLTSALAVVAGAVAADRLKGDRELGEYLSSECVTCHQISGRYDGIPPIVGWPEESFVEILGQYRDKTRENPVMRSIAVKFTDDEIAALAAYFGSLKPRTD